MLVFDGQSRPMILDSIYTPTSVEFVWVLDLNLMDFTMTELTILEETISPSIEIQVGGFSFVLPASWNILVYDRDTSQVDVVSIAETAGREFTAFTYGPKAAKPVPRVITATNYLPAHVNVGPSLNKHQMLCHPIGPDEWVVVSGSDGYNKYLKNCVVGDLIG